MVFVIFASMICCMGITAFLLATSESELFPVDSTAIDFLCSCQNLKYDFHRDVAEVLIPERRQYPSSLLEQTRRHISQTIREQWLFMHNQMKALQRVFSSQPKRNSSKNYKFENILRYMGQHGSEYSRVLEREVKKLATLDGWDKWRKKEAQDLKDIVRSRLIKLQNPANCSEAPVLVCNLTNPYGFASGIHDVLWCFIKAYKENRRLILETSHWHYAPGGWETLFQPLSETCPSEYEMKGKVSAWPGGNNNKVRWIMRTIPRDLGDRIIRLHGNPLAWWYGQFLHYLLRPNKYLKSLINTIKKNLNFSKGIVGIHVRRTDKIDTEAKAHSLEEYMEHAEGYYQSIELVSMRNIKRRVYIATDEPNVLTECQARFSDYECLYYPGSAQSATKMETRYSNTSLWSLVIDIFALSETDFLVCTLSSGMCRLAYELKLAMDETSVDASDQVLSLDVPHHYAWTTPAARKAIYNHKSKSPKEISFVKGDILLHKDEYSTVNAAVRGKTANGFVKMINSKKQITEGFVPTYKTREMFKLINFSVNCN